MSTFNGIVAEFPDIRIDYFRFESRNAPLACFLSHIHSDHIQGLENLTSPPFIYCSEATKELLIRLEKYPDRINYANIKGLPAPLATYRHLDRERNGRRLKPLPLDTSCQIELHPGYTIQVTLLDANHCPGSVMFLIEGQGQAILYTGDVRCEPWVVNALTQHPCMLVYSSQIKTLDKIYLDTSFTDDYAFPTQAEGCQELIQKLAPRFEEDDKDTIYHFQAWTWGYEKVWVALGKALNTKIHVDSYKMRLLKSLRTPRDPNVPYAGDIHLTPEAPALVGFMCGNHEQQGFLTSKSEGVRVHSCEKGNYCDVVHKAAEAGKVVWIQPIITRLPGGAGDMVEVGIGGGGDADEQVAELDTLNEGEAEALVRFLTDKEEVLSSGDEGVYDEFLAKHGVGADAKFYSPMDLLKAVLQALRLKEGTESTEASRPPRKITFPFSRHSSLPELQHLVAAFKPRDVWPCTENPQEWLKKGKSIKSLFGDFCSSDVFEYDENLRRFEEFVAAKSQATTTTIEDIDIPSSAVDCTVDIQHTTTTMIDEVVTAPVTVDCTMAVQHVTTSVIQETDACEITTQTSQSMVQLHSSPPPEQQPCGTKRSFDDIDQVDEGSKVTAEDEYLNGESRGSTISCDALEKRLGAADAIRRNASGQGYVPINLMSTMDNHSMPDIDLDEG